MRSVGELSLIMAFGLLGCGPKVVSIEIYPRVVEIARQGNEVTLNATPKDAEGRKVENVVLTFTTTNAAIATVEAQTGIVKAVKSGDARIRASVGEVSAEVPVRVSIPASISVVPSEVKLVGVGARANVTAKVLDDQGREVKSAVTSWENGDPAIASVRNGEITAVARGETRVFAVNGGARNQVRVEVIVPEVATIDTDRSLELKLGESPTKMRAIGKDPEGKEVAQATFRYAIEDAKVATVDGAGLVTAVGMGRTKLTVSSGEKSVVVEVRVKK